ncbi:MAG: phage portal protein [Oscillospiraceae bacterium]|nr:phage portal protein [Oscillospiraceae bacterium]
MNLKSLFRSRDHPRNQLGGDVSFPWGGTISGKVVNEQTAMTVTAVYACVRILAEAIAGLPLHVYHYKPDGGKERDISHPLFRLLHDAPNPEMTSFVFRETLMAHLLLHGNAYAQIIRDGHGRVLALYPLLPGRMRVSRDKRTGQIVYSYTKDEGPAVPLSKDDVLHIPGLGFDGLIGYSPIAMAKNSIGMALATEEYGAAFFANGANPGGVLEHPGVIKDVQRVKDSWNAGYRGSGNAHKIALLEDGMKFHAIGIPPEQAQFLETRKFQITEIARIFRVPPHMLADLERATFSNIEHQSLEFVKYCLNPWVVRWEQALMQALLLPGEKAGYFIRFNMEGLLRGDFKSRTEGYATGRQNGWLSANDIRELEDMNRIPELEGGDAYLVNGNMISITTAMRSTGLRRTANEPETE